MIQVLVMPASAGKTMAGSAGNSSVIPLVKFEFQWKRGASGGCCDGFRIKIKVLVLWMDLNPNPVFLHSSFLTSLSQPCQLFGGSQSGKFGSQSFPPFAVFLHVLVSFPFERKSGTLQVVFQQAMPPRTNTYTCKTHSVCK